MKSFKAIDFIVFALLILILSVTSRIGSITYSGNAAVTSNISGSSNINK